jgi:hypothetical protein
MPILAVSSLLRVGGAPVPSLLAMLAVVVARSRIDNRIGNNRQNRTLARTLPRPSTRPAPPRPAEQPPVSRSGRKGHNDSSEYCHSEGTIYNHKVPDRELVVC